MLGSIRKFSTSIYAKILLAIIIIPFIFWGMGSSIRSGGKNIIVIIDEQKYAAQEFSNFINREATKKVNPNEVERFLSAFVGEKLIEKEIKLFNVFLSDKSLSRLIKHQKNFKRDNKFSRTEYEKFLLQNNITAVTFENILSNQEKKKQFLSFISGGIMPPNFLVNIAYDKINQKRDIHLIDLNKFFSKELIFTPSEIKEKFELNQNEYSDVYKSINLIRLSPKNLAGESEFTDLFFKKIDEIDDLIINGAKVNYISEKFNLEKKELLKINKDGLFFKKSTDEKYSKALIDKIFSIEESESTILIEIENEYLIAELIKTENILADFNDEKIKKKILSDLKKEKERKLVTELISKINSNNFNKYDFDQLSQSKNLTIEKITLDNANDTKRVKQEVLDQIYKYAEKKIIIVSEIDLTENYLIYIDKIKNVTIDKKSDDFNKYLTLSKTKLITDLYNTYDNYIKQTYDIEINYQTLAAVKNYFN